MHRLLRTAKSTTDTSGLFNYTASTIMIIIALFLIFGATTSFAASTRAPNIDQHAKKLIEEKVHASGTNANVKKTSLNSAEAASHTNSNNFFGYAMEGAVEDGFANTPYLSQLKNGDATGEGAYSYSDEKPVLPQPHYVDNSLRSISADSEDIDVSNESGVHVETDSSPVDISENAKMGLSKLSNSGNSR
ncbi:hypothetical protein AAHC03_04425 [Spirometra sp. Aus1]